MTHPYERNIKITITVIIVLGIALVATLVYGYKTITALKDERVTLQGKLSTAEATIIENERKISEYGATLEEIKQAYAVSKENGAELLNMLTEEKNRNEEFEELINDVSKTVGKLDKLSKLDPELLMKYSKVYFLNEHYAPEKVAEIPQEFRFKTEEPEYVDGKVMPFLRDLLEDAKEDGIELLVVSGYRSFDEQKSLKGAYTTMYGTGANAFSADQGYSEHQLGTTVDFTTTAIGGGLTGFQNTEAYSWLKKYAYKYGFVLSYPENNNYYIFEPWHWRFVGEDLADDLHDDGKYFYDADQREIDTYLLNIFD